MNAFLYGLGNGIGCGLANTLNYAMFRTCGGYNPLMFGGNPFMFGGGCCCNHWNMNPTFFMPPAMGSGILLSPTVSIFC